ncbi:hypothetical protein M758_UG294500 [Ceratodon purpureus]|nr:hypothetical protein M758_UG294500 [Ceratodon purpureus]
MRGCSIESSVVEGGCSVVSTAVKEVLPKLVRRGEGAKTAEEKSLLAGKRLHAIGVWLAMELVWWNVWCLVKREGMLQLIELAGWVIDRGSPKLPRQCCVLFILSIFYLSLGVFLVAVHLGGG